MTHWGETIVKPYVTWKEIIMALKQIPVQDKLLNKPNELPVHKRGCLRAPDEGVRRRGVRGTDAPEKAGC